MIAVGFLLPVVSVYAVSPVTAVEAKDPIDPRPEDDGDLFGDLRETILPDVHRFELTVGDSSLEFSLEGVKGLFEALFAHARE